MQSSNTMRRSIKRCFKHSHGNQSNMDLSLLLYFPFPVLSHLIFDLHFRCSHFVITLISCIFTSPSPHYFKHVKISALAMLKMVFLSFLSLRLLLVKNSCQFVDLSRLLKASSAIKSLCHHYFALCQVMHARSGGNIEVMGLMQVLIWDYFFI